MADWKKPKSPFWGDFYWFWLYNKLMNQGTDQEKMRLVELYEQSKSRSREKNWPIIDWLLLIFNGNQHFEYACDLFIYETKMAALQDDVDRRSEIKIEYESPELIAAKKRLLGDDYQTRDADNARLERELKANHTNEQTTFVKDASGNHLFPSLENAMKQKLVKSGEQYVDKFTERIAIHYEIYDKCQGFYTAIVWADNRPPLPDGTPVVRADFSAKFTGTAGITEITEHMIGAERIDAICGFKS